MPDGYEFLTSSTTRFVKVRNAVQPDPDFQWYKVSKKRLNDIAQLPVGWDGYRAPAVSLNNAIFALDILKEICIETTPPPQVVPGVNSNCQIEWHTLLGDMEINVKSPNHVEVFYSLLGDDPREDEVLLRNDFTEIIPFLRQITEKPEPTIAHAATA